MCMYVLFSIPDGSFKRFESNTVKLSAKETKWTSLEVGTRLTFRETDVKIRFRVRQVTGTFEKRAPGLSKNLLHVVAIYSPS